MSKNITGGNQTQEGKKWTVQQKTHWKKVQSLQTAKVMRAAGLDDRAASMETCHDTVTYISPVVDGVAGERQVHNVWDCKDRMCPMCIWKRSRKVFSQVSKVMDHMPTARRYLFLSLTVRNMPGEELKEAIKALMRGWRLLQQRDLFKVVRGWFRAYEVTYNAERNDYHPHMHVILAVDPSYFNKETNDYIRHEQWVQEWQDCMQLDYEPRVRIQTAKPKKDGTMGSTIAEIAKYTVKPADIDIWHVERAVEPIGTLAHALKGVNLVRFGREMLKIHKKLKLDDPIDGKLTETHELRPEVAYVIEVLRWGLGCRMDWGVESVRYRPAITEMNQ